jgi:hypothetical protein
VVTGQTIKTVEELNKELKTATENNDFQKAEQLKNEIKLVEERNLKLKQLEEDKKIAIFLENYDEIVGIEKKINDVKLGEETKPSIAPVASVSPSKTDNIAQQPANSNNLINYLKSFKPQSNSNLPKKTLAECDFKDKIIGNFGIGYRNLDFGGDYVFSYQFSNNRWWLNKYVAGGTFYDCVGGDFTSFQIGGQMTLLGDFDAIVLPYTSLGLGLGLRDHGETAAYIPVNYKLGSYLFVNKIRRVGAFLELNLYLNNDYTPYIKFGIAWSRVRGKVKHNR